MIHFEFTFVYGVNRGPTSPLSRGEYSCPSTFVELSLYLSQKAVGRGVSLFLNFQFNSMGLYVYWVAYFLSLIAFAVERIHVQCRRPQFNSWIRKIRWRRDRLPTPVFLGFPHASAGKESTSTWETWV